MLATIVEIIFAVGLVIALIQAGYYREATIILPIATGMLGYMKGRADGQKTKEVANEKIISDPPASPGA